MDTPTTMRVRDAIKDRALYLALLVRSFGTVLPASTVVELARAAIFEFGRIKGQRDGGRITPEDWVDRHLSKGSAAVFESDIVKEPGFCEQQMTYCPLKEAWQELGCSAEEIDLLCDIAMEVDRGRADYHGIPLEIPERMGAGGTRCRLVLRKG